MESLLRNNIYLQNVSKVMSSYTSEYFNDPPAKERGLKRCWKCKQIFHISEFGYNRNEKDGRGGYCKTCRRAMQQQSNFQAMCDRLLKRANYVCALCGSKNKINVHHILPRTMRGNDGENNLIVLCRNCHKEAHNGSFSNCYGVSNVCICNKCNHIWLHRKESTPLICPKCKSSHWNIEIKGEKE